MENFNLIDQTNIEKFGEIFPHMENILRCGWYSHNVETNSMHWSKGLYTILGLGNPSVKGSLDALCKFITPEDLELFKSEMTPSSKQLKSYRFEFSITDAQGLRKRLYAENYISPGESNGSIEYSGVIKDITESYFYKKALEQKIVQLDKSNHNLQEFVYVASHDLQEPLRKISTFTERLGSKFKNQLDQDGGAYVNRILTSTRNMKTLLEDLLNFSRLSFNEKTFEKLSLTECIDSVLSDLEIKIEEAKVSVTREDCLLELEAYPSQMKQLFNNLIGNAIKFRKSNEPAYIKISCHQVSQESYPDLPLVKDWRYLAITIQDNGIGFEQEFAERIFMIFQRLNGKSEYSGSGVGLAICKKIVENHHGFIFANSRSGVGTTFTIVLPQQQS